MIWVKKGEANRESPEKIGNLSLFNNKKTDRLPGLLEKL